MKPLFTLVSLLLLQFAFLNAGCQAVDSSAISNQEFKQALTGKDVVVLDVRTAEEFSGGHLAGAKNLDYLKTEEFKIQIRDLPKDRTYLVYCRSGVRSFKALRLMQEAGFPQVKHLRNGISGWDGEIVH